MPLPHSPVTLTTPLKADRNASILQRHNQGYTLDQIAREFGISLQRVHQIVRNLA